MGSLGGIVLMAVYPIPLVAVCHGYRIPLVAACLRCTSLAIQK